MSQKSDVSLVCPCCLMLLYWAIIITCWAGVILNSYGTPLNFMFFNMVVICKFVIWLLVDCFTFVWEFRFSWQCILSLWCGIYSLVQVPVFWRNLRAPPYALRMKAIGFPDALAPVYQITHHHIAEDHNIIIIKMQQYCESQFIYLADNRYHWCSI